MRPFKLALTAILLTALTAVLASAPADAKVRVSQKTKYYSIKGKSGPALARDLIIKGSRANRVRHAVATTLVDLKINNIRMGVRKSRCRVRRLSVNLRLTFTYPKLRNRKRTSRRLRKTWDSYYSQVVKHEKRHATIARGFARQVDKAFRSASTRKSRGCYSLTRVLKRKLRALERVHTRKQRAFDAKDARRNSIISKKAAFLLKTR